MDSLEKALAVFKLNLMAYPGSSNVYDSYGEALLLQGDTVKAIVNYRKSLELNPGNTQGVAVLKALGEDTDELLPDVEVDPELLERYVGQYELMPGFILTVTREGNQLKAQATGQQQFDIFPRSDTVFYWRVVEAQLTFIPNADGAVERVTLLQNGQELVGKRAQY
jgi:tetratricopeptide (TPR) repeat protein